MRSTWMRLNGAHALVRAAVAGGVALGSPAAAGSLSWSGSVGASTGTYLSSERTNSLYIYNGVTFTGSRVRLSATLPLIAQSAPLLYAGGSVVPPSGRGGSGSGGGGDGSGGGGDDGGHGGHHPKTAAVPATPEAHRTELGLGDPLLRADIRLSGDSAGRTPTLRLAAQAKAPLASSDAHGFGTGEWDYGAGVSVAARAGGGSVLADVGYWVLGDPSGLDLQNAVAYGVSYGRPLHPKLALLASFIGYSRLVDGVAPPAQAGLFASWWSRPDRSLSAGVTAGVTESAPDLSFSVGWRIGR